MLLAVEKIGDGVYKFHNVGCDVAILCQIRLFLQEGLFLLFLPFHKIWRIPVSLISSVHPG